MNIASSTLAVILDFVFIFHHQKLYLILSPSDSSDLFSSYLPRQLCGWALHYHLPKIAFQVSASVPVFSQSSLYSVAKYSDHIISCSEPFCVTQSLFEGLPGLAHVIRSSYFSCFTWHHFPPCRCLSHAEAEVIYRASSFLHLGCSSSTLYKPSFFSYFWSQFNVTSWEPFPILRAKGSAEHVFGWQTNQSGDLRPLSRPYTPGDKVLLS